MIHIIVDFIIGMIMIIYAGMAHHRITKHYVGFNKWITMIGFGLLAYFVLDAMVFTAAVKENMNDNYVNVENIIPDTIHVVDTLYITVHNIEVDSID
jgi:hypothetical protein